MPRLNKQAISKFIETSCQRQLFLNLQVEADLDGQTYPKRIVRPAIENARELGDQWEAEAMDEFGQAVDGSRLLNSKPRTQTIRGSRGQNLPRIPDTEMTIELPRALEDTFILQGGYDIVDSFKRRYNIWRFTYDAGWTPPLDFSGARPDVTWVRPARTFPQYIAPDGRLMDVLPGDDRLQLQVIDIKLSAEAGRRHFVELIYYMLTLAAWLDATGWSSRFVVVPDAAVWPKSYEMTALARLARQAQWTGAMPSLADLITAMADILKPARPAFDPIAQRLETFFSRDLPEVLTVQDWRTLDWQVKLHCATCDFLAIDRPSASRHVNHCDEEATRDDRTTLLAGLGRGSKRELEARGITTTAQLGAASPTNPAFLDHNQLRADRTILQRQADALSLGAPFVPPGRRTTALSDAGASDLKVFVTVDFDPGSAITYVFGVRFRWWTPQPAGTAWQAIGAPPNIEQFVYVVPDLDPASERDQLLNVIGEIARVIKKVEDERQSLRYTGDHLNPRVQFYIWDNVQAKHIRRIMGRHLDDVRIQQQFQGLIWRFPPESVLPAADLEAGSPVAVVKPALRTMVALPIPYDYSLLKAAREYCPTGTDPRRFNVNSLFESGLGDQIPYERAHEVWSRQGYRNARTGTTIPWNRLQTMMEQTVEAKLLALESVTGRLAEDLRRQNRLLLKPKHIKIGRRPARMRGVSVDGELWVNYARLDATGARLENKAIRAMDLEEREARYHTAILDRRLAGPGRLAALSSLGVTDSPDVWVYAMRATSAEVKMNVGDFLWALAPLDDPAFLERRVFDLTGRNDVLAQQLAGNRNAYAALETFTKVSILEIDRESLWLAVRLDDPQFMRGAEQGGWVDFSRDVVVDKVYKDFWTDKLVACVRAIGNPPVASPAAESRVALQI